MERAKGGRGLKAENKYERFTVTLSPDLKAYLDALGERLGISRSEALSRVLDEHKTSHTSMSSKSELVRDTDRGEERGATTGPKGWPKELRPTLPNVDGFTAFRVVSTELSGSTRNLLRWKPERYTELEQQLSEGAVIRLVWAHGKQVWRTETGSTLRRDTVARLYGFGNLESLAE